MRKSEEMEKASQKMEIKSRQCERTDRGKVLRTGQHVSIRSEVSAVHLRGLVLLTLAGHL